MTSLSAVLVQVYTAREYVNALINNRVEEILIMVRPYTFVPAAIRMLPAH